MATPAQVLATVRNQVYESTAGYYSDEEIYSYMWQAETELAKQLRCTETTNASTSTVASTREYSKPTGCLEILRLTWDTVKLKRIDFTDLDKVEGTAYGNTGETGDPVYYYEFANVVGLSPVPTSAETLKFYYIQEPSALTAASTSFTIPNDLGFYLGDYCLYRMYLKDDSSEKASMHLQLWENNKRKAQRDWTSRRLGDAYMTVKDVSEYPSSDLGII